MSEETTEETAGLFNVVSSLPAPAEYAEADRFRDFRTVFMGSDEGKRVLREILRWTHQSRPSFAVAGPIDPYRTHIHEGERNIGLRLIDTLTRQPRPQRPRRANTKPKDDA